MHIKSQSLSFPMTTTRTIRTTIILCVCLIINRDVTAFVSLSHHHSPLNHERRCMPFGHSLPAIFAADTRRVALMAKKGGGVNKGGNSGTGRKKKSTNKKGNVKKNLKKHEARSKRSAATRKKDDSPLSSSSSSSSSSSKPGGGGGGNSHAPPWQVMSAKDTKKNVETEIKRRSDIQSGNLPSSTTTSSSKADITASSSLLTPTDRRLYNWKRFNPDKDVTSLTLHDAYLGTKSPPPLGVPEIAFLGRSNAGKSSLLNRLAKRSGGSGSVGPIAQARVGRTPGATASVNLYRLRGRRGRGREGDVLGLADLPGFGYAKLSKGVKEEVEEAAERYLAGRKELVLGVLLVDVRRVPSDDDRGVLAALYDMEVPLVVVATKVDKLKKNALPAAVEAVRLGLGLPDGQPLCVSSVTGEGVKEVWKIILDACEEKVDEWRGDDEEESEFENDNRLDEDGVIQLDDQGNWIEEEGEQEELEYDQGYEWAHNYDSDGQLDDDNYDDDDLGSDAEDDYAGEDSIRKMAENAQMQAAANEAMKLKNLKKIARKMQKDGKV